MTPARVSLAPAAPAFATDDPQLAVAGATEPLTSRQLGLVSTRLSHRRRASRRRSRVGEPGDVVLVAGAAPPSCGVPETGRTPVDLPVRPPVPVRSSGRDAGGLSADATGGPGR